MGQACRNASGNIEIIVPCLVTHALSMRSTTGCSSHCVLFSAVPLSKPPLVSNAEPGQPRAILSKIERATYSMQWQKLYYLQFSWHLRIRVLPHSRGPAGLCKNCSLYTQHSRRTSETSYEPAVHCMTLCPLICVGSHNLACSTAFRRALGPKLFCLSTAAHSSND